MFICNVRPYLPHLRMIIHDHLLRLHELRYAELMLGLRLHLQRLFFHHHRKMQRTFNGLVRQLGIQLYSGDIDMLINSVLKMHMHLTLHLR